MHTKDREHSHGLQVADDLPLQAKIWKVERIAWVVFSLLLLAAMLGLFGGGILSKTKQSSADQALRIEYERFGRYQAPTDIKLHIAAQAVRGEFLRVWFDARYLEEVELSQISPAPHSTEVAQGKHIYQFKIATPGQPVSINFEVKGNNYGQTHLLCGLENGPELSLTQFFYP